MKVQPTGLQAAETARREFVRGFAQGAGLPSAGLAATIWNDYSQFVSRRERQALEEGGLTSGQTLGSGFRSLFEGFQASKD